MLREEHRLTVFENRVLRRICGPKRDEVTGEWMKLHNEELHNLYSFPHIIRQIKSRRMRWAGHVAFMGEERKLFRFLMGKLEGKRPLRRPRSRWVNGIRMDLRDIHVAFLAATGKIMVFLTPSMGVLDFLQAAGTGLVALFKTPSFLCLAVGKTELVIRRTLIVFFSLHSIVGLCCYIGISQIHSFLVGPRTRSSGQQTLWLLSGEAQNEHPLIPADLVFDFSRSYYHFLT
jgi:hypothetical protein